MLGGELLLHPVHLLVDGSDERLQFGLQSARIERLEAGARPAQHGVAHPQQGCELALEPIGHQKAHRDYERELLPEADQPKMAHQRITAEQSFADGDGDTGHGPRAGQRLIEGQQTEAPAMVGCFAGDRTVGTRLASDGRQIGHAGKQLPVRAGGGVIEEVSLAGGEHLDRGWRHRDLDEAVLHVDLLGDRAGRCEKRPVGHEIGRIACAQPAGRRVEGRQESKRAQHPAQKLRA